MKLRVAVVATVLVTVACTTNPAPVPTSSPPMSNPAPTSSEPTQTSSHSAAPGSSTPADSVVFEPPEKLEGEIARITYLDNAVVAEQGTALDPQISYQMRVSCYGQGSITAELWVNGVKIPNDVTWGCSDELSAAVNVDAAMPALQGTDDVQIRFPEVSSNQEAWAVLEPAVSTEE